MPNSNSRTVAAVAEHPASEAHRTAFRIEHLLEAGDALARFASVVSECEEIPAFVREQAKAQVASWRSASAVCSPELPRRRMRLRDAITQALGEGTPVELSAQEAELVMGELRRHLAPAVERVRQRVRDAHKAQAVDRRVNEGLPPIIATRRRPE